MPNQTVQGEIVTLEAGSQPSEEDGILAAHLENLIDHLAGSPIQKHNAVMLLANTTLIKTAPTLEMGLENIDTLAVSFKNSMRECWEEEQQRRAEIIMAQANEAGPRN